MVPAQEPLDDAGYGFDAAERSMTRGERRREIVRFLSWLSDNASVDALLLADASGSGRLRQVLDEDEFVALVQAWEQAEEDAACAAAERAYEGG